MPGRVKDSTRRQLLLLIRIKQFASSNFFRLRRARIAVPRAHPQGSSAGEAAIINRPVQGVLSHF